MDFENPACQLSMSTLREPLSQCCSTAETAKQLNIEVAITLHYTVLLSTLQRTDLSPCESDLSPCESDLSPCESDLSPCESDLSPCESDLSPCGLHLFLKLEDRLWGQGSSCLDRDGHIMHVESKILL